MIFVEKVSLAIFIIIFLYKGREQLQSQARGIFSQVTLTPALKSVVNCFSILVYYLDLYSCIIEEGCECCPSNHSQLGGIDSSESIPVLHKRLQIRAQK